MQWTDTVLRDYVLPTLRPDVLIDWIGPLDGAQHANGVGSPQAQDALRQLDRVNLRGRTANWLRMIAHRRAGQEAQAKRIEALLSPGSVIPRLGLVAGPLSLPADLPAGTYTLWAGLYDPSDNVRVTASGLGAALDQRVALGTLHLP